MPMSRWSECRGRPLAKFRNTVRCWICMWWNSKNTVRTHLSVEDKDVWRQSAYGGCC